LTFLRVRLQASLLAAVAEASVVVEQFVQAEAADVAKVNKISHKILPALTKMGTSLKEAVAIFSAEETVAPPGQSRQSPTFQIVVAR